MFVLVQPVRHREYFLPAIALGQDHVTASPGGPAIAFSALLMVAALCAVILLAKALAPMVELGVDAVQAPRAVAGVVIAALVLLPESLAVLAAALGNRIQTSQPRARLATGSSAAETLLHAMERRSPAALLLPELPG